jgi:hypothetical protein
MKSIGFNRAMEMMRLPEHRLVKMSTSQSPDGVAHFVVPGGYVSPEVAQKIKNHPLVHPMQDGLFPGHSQTWRIEEAT